MYVCICRKVSDKKLTEQEIKELLDTAICKKCLADLEQLLNEHFISNNTRNTGSSNALG